MQGIQHLFRQHALDKQTSNDSWHSAQSSISNQMHLQQHYGSKHPNTLSIDGSSTGSFNQGLFLFKFFKNIICKIIYKILDKVLEQLSSSPRPVPGAVSSSPIGGSLPKSSSRKNGGFDKISPSSAFTVRNYKKIK